MHNKRYLKSDLALIVKKKDRHKRKTVNRDVHSEFTGLLYTLKYLQLHKVYNYKSDLDWSYNL